MQEPDLRASSLPIGASVDFAADSHAAERPTRTTLTGDIVSIVPVDPAAHALDLYRASHGAQSERLWLYMAEGPYPNFASFEDMLRKRVASNDPLFFTIADTRTNEALGLAAYLNIQTLHRTIEVGNILYTPGLQRTAGATEAMYLMARYAFEGLHYRRYEWKCNALNEPSRRAALRLGFTFEGLFRQHMVVKGRNRDTAWFSMLDREWPVRKAAFERWLRPSNFDADGKQIESLPAIRAALEEQARTSRESSLPNDESTSENLVE